MKRALDDLLLGNLLTPVLCLVLGGVFGLWAFVIARAVGLANQSPLPPYGIALLVGLLIAGAINALLKPPKHTDH